MAAMALAANASAQSFSVCALDAKQQVQKRDAAPSDARDAAGSSGAAFGQSPIDLFTAVSQDPLNQRAVRDDVSRSVRPTAEPAHWRTPPAPKGGGMVVRSVPSLRDAPQVSVESSYGPPVEQGSANDAQSIHDGNPATVAAAGSEAAFLGYSKSPNAFGALTKMSRRAGRAALAGDAQNGHFKLERIWDGAPRPALTPDAEAAASQDTKFFIAR